MLILFFLLFLSIILWTLMNGISPMPTSFKVTKCLLPNLPPIDGKIYDLGSGFGTLLRSLAKRYPTLEIQGAETSPIPYLFSLLYTMDCPKVKIQWQNFYKLPLTDAALILCYLYPGAMGKLKIKFEEELTPGCLVISHTFAIPGWKPFKIVDVPDLYRTKIYFYKK